MAAWRNFLGLPHRFGADPADGHGADCLVMVFRILEDLGLPHPPFDPVWLELAGAGRWDELQTIWAHLTSPLPGAMEGAVALIRNGSGGLGVGVVIEGGLLMVHHRRGVVWIPLHLLRLTYHRFL